MNTKRKILLDKSLGAFIVFPLNYLVRFVGLITNFDHSLRGKKRNIVVCKYKGMGSIIQSTPLIQTLRLNFPEANIIFVSSIENKAILNRIEVIDQVEVVDDRGVFRLMGTSIGLLFKLIRTRIDLYIDLEIYSNYSSIMATCSLAKDRFGYYLNTSENRMGMYTHMMYFNTTSPITESYLQFARLLECKEMVHEQYVFEEKTELHPNIENYIIINPNASDLRIERRWPKNNFVDLIKQVLIQENTPRIVLIGAKNEVEYVQQISKHFADDKRVIDLSGKTTLNELIELIRYSNYVITNDTGPMHLSSALKKKTIALFGPCSPQQYAVGKHIIPIYKNLYCSPCVHEFTVPPCKGNNQCMQSIHQQDVWNAMNDVNNETSRKPVRKIKFVGNDGKALGKVFRKV